MQLKDFIVAHFMKYVKFSTASDENSQSCPSSTGQLMLGRQILKDLKAIGMKKAAMDKNGYVTAELPATARGKSPVIAFLAHMDTAPDASGEGVKPQLHKNYRGGRIIINAKDRVFISDSDSPGLGDCKGHDIITASGKTLLGADNKAGIAIIIGSMDYLLKHPEIPHGVIKVAFTPDEEVGRGVDLFNVKKFGADYAYTMDGDRIGTVEDETFNADGLKITVEGKSVHPGSAKNSMANAVRIAADLIASWPAHLLPETTEHRQGFVMFTSCKSGIEAAEISGIIRDHDLKKLKSMERSLLSLAAQKRKKYPLAKIKVEFREQYRNMRQVLKKHPLVMDKLFEALKIEGVRPIHKPVRGGTDGARLSFLGLPCPNIFVGGNNFHGRHEWVSVQGMELSAKVVIRLARLWNY
ncbi:MAG TPA: peptidase T [Elusimicrobiales bacterium]|nr:peptidase T [Elusimicrobiales bacterium]